MIYLCLVAIVTPRFGGSQYADDLREGTGTEIFPSFDNEREDEAGEKTFPYFEGQFLDGMRHGKGIYHYAEGDYYQVLLCMHQIRMRMLL